MPLSQTLAAVERDIVNGDLGKARDRLHGLISAYPADLSLRRRLGEVYGSLQDPAMAGRYWYLEAVRTPDMQAACAAFERSCGGDPLEILRALKYRGDVGAVQDEYAGRILRDLEARAKSRYGWLSPRPARPGPGGETGTAGHGPYSQKILLAGCVLVGLLALALMIFGLMTLISRLFG